MKSTRKERSADTRACDPSLLCRSSAIEALGLSSTVIRSAVSYVYETLDGIDGKLLEASEQRLAELLELANLSAIVGNLFRAGIVRASDGAFAANAPHTYPDLIGRAPGCSDIEIKVALEDNSPKGHLVKAGPHVILRYVLGDARGGFTPGKQHRGGVAWIWDIRAGWLKEEHFNISNTAGDSGKTAVINAAGMSALEPVYCDLDRSPLPRKGRLYRDLAAVVASRRMQEPGLGD